MTSRRRAASSPSSS
uniref:Uncharacterized protein n=1 Tax=Arundo donax TaxID=35708 RepID=A0A0A9FJP2_ARUDO